MKPKFRTHIDSQDPGRVFLTVHCVAVDDQPRPIFMVLYRNLETAKAQEKAVQKALEGLPDALGDAILIQGAQKAVRLK